jgi:hypothetical protein
MNCPPWSPSTHGHSAVQLWLSSMAQPKEGLVGLSACDKECKAHSWLRLILTCALTSTHACEAPALCSVEERTRQSRHSVRTTQPPLSQNQGLLRMPEPPQLADWKLNVDGELLVTPKSHWTLCQTYNDSEMSRSTSLLRHPKSWHCRLGQERSSSFGL